MHVTHMALARFSAELCKVCLCLTDLPLLPLPTPLQTLGIEAARNALLKELRGAWPGLLLLLLLVVVLLAGCLPCLHACIHCGDTCCCGMRTRVEEPPSEPVHPPMPPAGVIEFDGSYVNYRHLAALVDSMTSR